MCGDMQVHRVFACMKEEAVGRFYSTLEEVDVGMLSCASAPDNKRDPRAL